MAQRVHRFAVASAPGSTQAAPNTTTLAFPPGDITAITVEIPAGHTGRTGLAINYGENQLIPLGGTAWLRGDKLTVRYDYDDPFPGGAGWTADHFNLGARTHTFYLSIEVDNASVADTLPPVMLLRRYGSV